MIPQELLRRHYAETALARLGVAFERGIEVEAVRVVVEGAARNEMMRLEAMKAAA